MSDRTPPRTRLYVDTRLAAGDTVELGADRLHYLSHVLRLKAGDGVRVFNGDDGEWLAGIDTVAKGRCRLAIEKILRPPAPEPDLWLLAAPIKRAHFDLVAEKATELGISRLWPVWTRHAVMSRVNTDRLRALAVEAAEQCGRLTVPEVSEPADLAAVLGAWPRERRLVVLDERGGGAPIAEALAPLPDGPGAVLTGPEGGFAHSELDLLRDLPFAVPVSLGSRILRAETAAIAALACWQALRGDWREPVGGRS